MSKTKVKTKLKTNRSAAKRIKISGSGKIMRRKGWKRHLLSTKNASRRRRLSGDFEIAKSERENFQQMLPYGVK